MQVLRERCNNDEPLLIFRIFIAGFISSVFVLLQTRAIAVFADADNTA
jgi:hypothetical protein